MFLDRNARRRRRLLWRRLSGWVAPVLFLTGIAPIEEHRKWVTVAALVLLLAWTIDVALWMRQLSAERHRRSYRTYGDRKSYSVQTTEDSV